MSFRDLLAYKRWEGRPCKPQEPRITTPGNAVLAAYLYEETRPTAAALSTILDMPETLLVLLKAMMPHPVTVRFPNISEEYLRRHKNWRIQYVHDHQLLKAREEERCFTFSSGIKAPYVLLTDERSANMPISFGAWLYGDQIYIRQSYLVASEALATKSARKDSALAEMADEFSQVALATCLAHEIAESSLTKPDEEHYSLEHELEAELEARKFLTLNGIDKARKGREAQAHELLLRLWADGCDPRTNVAAAFLAKYCQADTKISAAADCPS